ncbi:hypothetical protein ES703_118059 [subsurface metagenome]
MDTLSGRHEPETSSSLVNENTSARKRSGRMFHRVMSGLSKKGTVRIVTLTTSDRSHNKDFQRHFRMLRMRLLRRNLLVDYIRCPEFTDSGLRHEHILFRGSYIEQVYLSKLWAEIHHAPVVDIRLAKKGNRALAGHLARYMAKAPAGRCGYSWGWVWRGFAGSWARLKKFGWELGVSMDEVLTFWNSCVRVGTRPEELLPI